MIPPFSVNCYRKYGALSVTVGIRARPRGRLSPRGRATMDGVRPGEGTSLHGEVRIGRDPGPIRTRELKHVSRLPEHVARARVAGAFLVIVRKVRSDRVSVP